MNRVDAQTLSHILDYLSGPEIHELSMAVDGRFRLKSSRMAEAMSLRRSFTLTCVCSQHSDTAQTFWTGNCCSQENFVRLYLVHLAPSLQHLSIHVAKHSCANLQVIGSMFQLGLFTSLLSFELTYSTRSTDMGAEDIGALVMYVLGGIERGELSQLRKFSIQSCSHDPSRTPQLEHIRNEKEQRFTSSHIFSPYVHAAIRAKSRAPNAAILSYLPDAILSIYANCPQLRRCLISSLDTACATAVHTSEIPRSLTHLDTASLYALGEVTMDQVRTLLSSSRFPHLRHLTLRRAFIGVVYAAYKRQCTLRCRYVHNCSSPQFRPHPNSRGYTPQRLHMATEHVRRLHVHVGERMEAQANAIIRVAAEMTIVDEGDDGNATTAAVNGAIGTSTSTSSRSVSENICGVSDMLPRLRTLRIHPCKVQGGAPSTALMLFGIALASSNSSIPPTQRD